MTIDWFTFGAQIVNFLVLVWLLSHFLYKPIVKAMQGRDEKIAATVKQAESAQQESEQMLQLYQQKTAELAHAKEQLLAEAGQEVQQWKAEHLAKAHEAVAMARDEWYRGLVRERQSFIREARLRVAKYVHDMSRRVLREIANENLQSRVIDVFLERFDQVSQTQKQAIAASIANTHHRVFVDSAFLLNEAERKRITAFVQTYVGSDVAIDFREEPDLICGIELRAAGHKVAWSVREPLEEMEQEFSRSLDEAITFELEAGKSTAAKS